MAKLTKTQANDKFLAGMRARGFDTVFVTELPYPMNTRNCGLILARNHNLIYIRDEVIA